MSIEKVCVRIPSNRKEELLAMAKLWREEDRPTDRSQGWDAKAIHRIAKDHFKGLEKMFEHHGWDERSKDMMPNVQRRVKETYGSIHAFVQKYEPKEE